MLELGTRELLTFGTVLGGLAATWGVIKANIKSLTEDLDEIKGEDNILQKRIDTMESNQAVIQNRLDIIGKDVLSPQILKKQSERDGAIDVRLKNIEIDLDRFHKMHNGKHPPVEKVTG